MPRSLLEGRPTPFTVEVDGKPVTGLMESPWTPPDLAAAMAVKQERDEKCDGCGQPLGLTTDPEHQFHFEAEAVRCHACKAQADELGTYDTPKARAGLRVFTTFTGDRGQ